MSELTQLQKSVESVYSYCRCDLRPRAEDLEVIISAAKQLDGLQDAFINQHKQLEAVHTSFSERGAALVRLQGMLEALKKENEVLMLRSVLAMHIADGDESWEKALCDCPMLDSVYSLKLSLESITKERDKRSRSVCRLMAEHTELKEQLQLTRAENVRMRKALNDIKVRSFSTSAVYKIAFDTLFPTTTDNSKEGVK